MKPYYEKDGIALYLGDCREILPGLAFDVVVTDPPYGMHKAEWDMALVPVESWLPLCHPRPTAVFTGNRGLFDYPRPSWTASWVRLGSIQRNGSLGGFSNWEPILLYNVERLRNDTLSEPNTHPELDHPSVKPLPLMKRLIALLPDGTVADPFTGTGTTLVVARDLGRRAIGIEIEEKYCEIAAKRLDQNLLPFGE